ncbi:MAG: glutamate-1-semialdehyde 2,1-aminomutase [Cyanobacteria bacterium REEB67]|nr:glutamate-1-semialdehyde 2,1-aminomutase [Cyanobacteria bacterium REEB67]
MRTETKLKLATNVGKARYKESLSHGARIESVIPGGVDSPFRAFNEVGGQAVFFSRAKGSRLFDLDNNTYIDYLGAWGPAILGHCPDAVVKACQEALALGPVFGSPHTLELRMAEQVIKACPSIEKIRFVSSGTEAVMSAIRLARGYSGKEKMIMFEGCYHGHCDPVLASNAHKSSSGIPEGSRTATLQARFNDLESVEALFQAHPDEIGVVIVEPVAGSMGVVPPAPDFLPGLRQLCDRYNAVLILDEVITGFRLALGGAQSVYGVIPDLTCFGKALGGGMPIGAYGGKKEIMERLIPDGDVYQAGTFSGNPVTMAGGIATIELLADPSVYERLEARSAQLFSGLAETVERLALPIQLQRAGSMFAIMFSAKPVRNFQDSLSVDHEAFSLFFHHLLDNGVYLPPSGIDAACMSAAHTEQDVEQSVKVMTEGLKLALAM